MSDKTIPDGLKLSNYLKINNITRTEFAKKMHISRSAVYAYFSTITLSDDVKAKIKDLFNVDFDELNITENTKSNQNDRENCPDQLEKCQKILDDYIEREKWLRDLIDKLS